MHWEEHKLPGWRMARITISCTFSLRWHGEANKKISRTGTKPLKELQKQLGFTPAKIVGAARKQLARTRGQRSLDHSARS
jgi:hypothetical protein